MAKSLKNLWPDVVNWDKLVSAYQKCRRRKRYRPDVVEFDYAWEANLIHLQKDLDEGFYCPGKYRHFFIRDPKQRKISAAPFRDRIVHHAVVRVLEPAYERRFIYDSYACRKNKGTHRALDRAHHYLRKHEFFLKTDIVRFFPNVDHAVMLDLLEKTIHDSRMMNLIRLIVDSGNGILADQATREYFPGDDLFAALRSTGLPIGNLTSQFFANILLDPIDHFIKEDLRIPGYVRYADDFVLFADSKQRLTEARLAIEQRLRPIRLKLHQHKTQVAPVATGLRFLGFVLTRAGRRLQQSTIRRFNRRLRRLRYEYKNRLITASQVRRSLNAWLAHAGNANSEGIRRELWKRVSFVRSR